MPVHAATASFRLHLCSPAWRLSHPLAASWAKCFLLAGVINEIKNNSLMTPKLTNSKDVHNKIR